MTSNKYEADPKLVCKDLNLLQPRMLIMVKELMLQQPYLKVVETLRSNSRQHVMFTTGKSKTDNSLHEIGMALDYIHKTLGYNAPKSWWIDIRKSWTNICAKHGYNKIAYPGFELGHISINDGTRC